MNPLTVVELFQSQGCSSCPPTNSNVLKLVDDPNMLVLTYDVTYWDKLGWKDTFGKSAFDQRQWEYARALQRRNVFTPQVIVNGLFDGVGSDARDLQTLIAKGRTPNTKQSAEIFYMIHGGGITVIGPDRQYGIVNVVRYDSEQVQVPISRGENGGRTLAHSHVVKDITQIGSWTGGRQDFKLIHTSDDGLKIAVLVQAGPGGPIIGAARI